jgi:hypothetical protein
VKVGNQGYLSFEGEFNLIYGRLAFVSPRLRATEDMALY